VKSILDLLNDNGLLGPEAEVQAAVKEVNTDLLNKYCLLGPEAEVPAAVSEVNTGPV